MLLSEFQLASIAKAASPTRLYADFSASMAHTSWHTMGFRDHDNWPGLQLLRPSLQLYPVMQSLKGSFVMVLQLSEVTNVCKVFGVGASVWLWDVYSVQCQRTMSQPSNRKGSRRQRR